MCRQRAIFWRDVDFLYLSVLHVLSIDVDLAGMCAVYFNYSSSIFCLTI